MRTYLRVNGTAPAWPALLEKPHPFYPANDPYSMASASYSVCKSKLPTGHKSDIDWEIIIDAGHITVPFLLNRMNRIPDAIILTHAHPDHILGVDWIVQSQRFGPKGNCPLPIYCTIGVWKSLMRSYSHILPHVIHQEIIPGIKIAVEETDGLSVTSFPVYHGEGAPGASMLLLEYTGSSNTFLITGDMLCPLLRRKDLDTLSRVRTILIDTNNLYPEPESNHISFTRSVRDNMGDSKRLSDWIKNKKITDLLKPHQHENEGYASYFNEFLNDWNKTGQLIFTILDLLRHVNIPEVWMVHYWGVYDEKFYNQSLLDAPGLEDWANRRAGQEGVRNIRFRVPKIGDITYF